MHHQVGQPDEGTCHPHRLTGTLGEDEAGRERILIGAPVPETANRIRTDEARVREVWAPKFPDADAYMGYH